MFILANHVLSINTSTDGGVNLIVYHRAHDGHDDDDGDHHQQHHDHDHLVGLVVMVLDRAMSLSIQPTIMSGQLINLLIITMHSPVHPSSGALLCVRVPLLITSTTASLRRGDDHNLRGLNL